METVRISSRQVEAIDLERIYQEWRARLPDSLSREAPLSEADLRLALQWAVRALADPSAPIFGQVEAAIRSLARSAIASSPVELLLRVFRDELIRILFRRVPPEQRAPTAITQLACRIGDVLWSTHAQALQETIARQRDERFEQELLLAKSIQQRLLPRRVPSIPGFDVAGRVLAAREVGGDYWSVKQYPDDGVVTFKLADVTGHGIAAATLVAAVKFISGGFYRGARNAAQVMERTNHVLVKETPSEIMIPMVYGWLYPDTYEASVVNAGHEPFFLRRADGRMEDIPPTGLVLGLMETGYGELRVRFEPGDLLFACSDGITAAAAGESLGVERVKAIVAADAHLPAALLVQRVLDAALAFYGTPKDDMSLIVLKRTE